ncbi:MAG: RraA family protein, partial [Alphaproteobacteria bacterium]|nr:RraA family protein [Alphaproteobacteria bacterium]
ASPLEAIDVNYADDFELAELIAAGKREKERKLFKNLGNLLSSSMLSDILDDLKIDGVINNLKLNLEHKKILGYAKTLKLKKLNNNESYTSIYDALESYDSIISEDIIVVENECPEYAYFGELNASLAIRSGAIGAIIGGKTRDSAEVNLLDFPVYSTGYSCKDVRKRAIVESVNKTINLFGVFVSPGDLIFGDNDGI